MRCKLYKCKKARGELRPGLCDAHALEYDAEVARIRGATILVPVFNGEPWASDIKAIDKVYSK